MEHNQSNLSLKIDIDLMLCKLIDLHNMNLSLKIVTQYKTSHFHMQNNKIYLPNQHFNTSSEKIRFEPKWNI
jgi:hypothetical protein